MQVSASTIKRLLDAVLEHEELAPDQPGFEKLAILINEEQKQKQKKILFTDRYFSENLYGKSRKALKNGDTEIGVSRAHINTIAQYHGFRDFREFENQPEKPNSPNLIHNPILEKLQGSWGSYVRVNSGEDKIYAAPVSIYKEEGKYMMKLYGLSRTFEGSISLVGNSLVTTLYSNQGKILNLIFHVGIAIDPKLLQGVFSGMSTGGEPIVGREILVRQGEDENELPKARVVIIPEEDEAKPSIDIRIIRYFGTYEGNCLRAGRSSSFTLGDLEIW